MTPLCGALTGLGQIKRAIPDADSPSTHYAKRQTTEPEQIFIQCLICGRCVWKSRVPVNIYSNVSYAVELWIYSIDFLSCQTHEAVGWSICKRWRLGGWRPYCFHLFNRYWFLFCHARFCVIWTLHHICRKWEEDTRRKIEDGKPRKELLENLMCTRQ